MPATVCALRRSISRRKRREEIAAEMAARPAAERAPVPGLDQLAALNGWAPVDPPNLNDEDVGCVCRLTMGTHGVVDPDKKRRQWFRQLFSTVPYSPAFSQYEEARLVNCYQGEFDGRAFVVGNAFYDIRFILRPAGYSGPMAAPGGGLLRRGTPHPLAVGTAGPGHERLAAFGQEGSGLSGPRRALRRLHSQSRHCPANREPRDRFPGGEPR